MVPVIYSVTPSSGHSGGGQILQINGAGFRTQSPFANVLPGVTVSGRRIHGPWPTPQAPPDPTMQSNPVVPTTCAVYFSGYAFQQNPGGGPLLLVAADPVPAVNVGVVSSGILQCTTPVHDPSGIPYIDPTPNKAGQIAVPPSWPTMPQAAKTTPSCTSTLARTGQALARRPSRMMRRSSGATRYRQANAPVAASKQ